MSNVIHARLREGKYCFRIWSENSDSYLTAELTEEELVGGLQYEALSATLSRLPGEIERRISRAKELGSSSLVGNGITVDQDWEQELNKPEDEYGWMSTEDIVAAAQQILPDEDCAFIAGKESGEALNLALLLVYHKTGEDPVQALRNKGLKL